MKYLKKNDRGFVTAPWVFMSLFLAFFLILYIYYQSIGISAKYIVQDALASAVLAGEVVDVDILSEQDEYVIMDLSETKNVFESVLKNTLHLDDDFRPAENSIYFPRNIPVQIQELILYNVSKGQIYKTDLLCQKGVLNYDGDIGLANEPRAVCIGSLLKNKGELPEEVKDEDYKFELTMLDGEKKKIKGTSLYARISLGLKMYGGGAAVVEKDIFADITAND